MLTFVYFVYKALDTGRDQRVQNILGAYQDLARCGVSYARHLKEILIPIGEDSSSSIPGVAEL